MSSAELESELNALRQRYEDYKALGLKINMMRGQPSPEQLTLRLAVRDMRDGLVYLRTKRAILAMLGAILFINFFFAPVTGNFIP